MDPPEEDALGAGDLDGRLVFTHAAEVDDLRIDACEVDPGGAELSRRIVDAAPFLVLTPSALAVSMRAVVVDVDAGVDAHPAVVGLDGDVVVGLEHGLAADRVAAADLETAHPRRVDGLAREPLERGVLDPAVVRVGDVEAAHVADLPFLRHWIEVRAADEASARQHAPAAHAGRDRDQPARRPQRAAVVAPEVANEPEVGRRPVGGVAADLALVGHEQRLVEDDLSHPLYLVTLFRSSPRSASSAAEVATRATSC